MEHMHIVLVDLVILVDIYSKRLKYNF